ncbi:hypothetical protein D3C78_1843920 [compost metagenome]
MARQANGDFWVITLGAGNVIHNALQFFITGFAVDQAVDLNGDKHLRNAVFIAVIFGNFSDR